MLSSDKAGPGRGLPCRAFTEHNGLAGNIPKGQPNIRWRSASIPEPVARIPESLGTVAEPSASFRFAQRAIPTAKRNAPGLQQNVRFPAGKLPRRSVVLARPQRTIPQPQRMFARQDQQIPGRQGMPSYRQDVVEGRWLVETRHSGRNWEVVIEPDFDVHQVLIITAYPVW